MLYIDIAPSVKENPTIMTEDARYFFFSPSKLLITVNFMLPMDMSLIELLISNVTF